MTDNNIPPVPPTGSTPPPSFDPSQNPQTPPAAPAAPAYGAPQTPPAAPGYQQPAAGYGAPVYGAPAPAAEKWNVLSIVSIIGAVVGFNVIAAILGFVALSQIKKTGEQGKVLAIIAIVLGLLTLVGIIIGVIVFSIALASVGTIDYSY